MKRVSCAIAAILTIISSMFCFCLNASAYNYAKGWSGHPDQSVFIDEKGLFTEKQCAELTEEIQEYAKDLKLNIVVYVASNWLSDSQTEIFADDTYDEMFGEDTDGVFYYMDLSGKSPAYDYISTSGKAVLNYQRRINSIFGSLDAYLPPSSVSSYEPYRDEIFRGVECFLEKLAQYSEIGSNTKTLYYYKDISSGKYFYYKHGELVIDKGKPPAMKLMILGGALLIGLIVAIVAYFIGKSSYKFKPSTSANVYISREEIKKGEWDDRFIRTYTSKTRIQSSSGGSRGGHGGGHSHSGGHGGGGHHR